jgi:hypothetical protein
MSGKVYSDTLNEAALRLALSISRADSCTSQETMSYSVAVLPFDDDSQSLSEAAMDQLHADLMSILLQEGPSCLEVTDVGSALETLSYFQSLGRWSDLGAHQREEVQERLAGVNAIVSTTISRVDGMYSAAVELTSLSDGSAVASVSFDVPEQYSTQRCGASAMSEALGLEALATTLIERLGRASALYVEPASYQNTEEALVYGHYITDQFIGSLSSHSQNLLTGANLSVRASQEDEQVILGENEYSLELRYWPCDDLSAVRVNLIATSSTGSIVSLSQELSLEAVPVGVEIVPVPTEESEESDQPSSAILEDPVDLGVIRVSPRLVGVGEILTLYAEPPASCAPFFFDLSEGGQLTPIPLDIFDISEVRPGLIRYENNAQSQLGIIIQPEDEPGIHRFGFICQPPELSNDGIRNVFRQLRNEFAETNQGVLTADDLEIIFNTMSYEIFR